jgi:uncharacterized protein (TIGR00369 family)
MHDLAGSAFNEVIGFGIAEWREDYVELLLELQPMHLNRSGVVHGGVLATLIDAAGGFAGCYCNVPGNIRRALTLALNTQFTGQTQAGVIKTVGRKSAGGRKIFFATLEVFSAEGLLIATGQGTYRYRAGSETLQGAPAES